MVATLNLGHPLTDTATDILGALVSFDTTSSKTNIPLIEWVERYLDRHGVSSVRVETEDGLKSSLYATIGPTDMPGIGLSGHTDVVPVTGQEWSSDPFQLNREGTRLYGRGSCDMKGFLACALAKLPDFKSADLTLPIHLLFSYDEEVGCTGVRPMIARLGKDLVRPAMIIVGEPTNMEVVDAHKGATRFEVTITGLEAHSSMAHLGVNAIVAAADLIAELRRIELELQNNRDDRFTPPYSTVQVGMIEGGQAPNIVPNHCRFIWDVRSLPGLDPDALADRLRNYAETHVLPEMRERTPDADIVIERYGSIPAFQAADKNTITTALGLAQQNALNAVSYGTEAGLFEIDQCPSIICGPGDIAQAHAADEFIEIDQLSQCLSFMDRLQQHCSKA